MKLVIGEELATEVDLFASLLVFSLCDVEAALLYFFNRQSYRVCVCVV